MRTSSTSDTPEQIAEIVESSQAHLEVVGHVEIRLDGARNRPHWMCFLATFVDHYIDDAPLLSIRISA
jgi:hypothetical protein